MFHNFLINENKRNYTKEIDKNNIQGLSKKDIMPKYTNINKEIKKKASDLRKCFNIKNSIFKEMQSKNNSLTYKELMSYLGKYFFGPNGIVTEKYKFLRDYYEERNLKIGLSNRIYAGTLDYFFILSHYNSYSQRLNLTKEKLLSLSNNLAIASSAFDKVNQKAINKVRHNKNNKNYVLLNIKNSFSAGKNMAKNNNINNNSKDNSQINKINDGNNNKSNIVINKLHLNNTNNCITNNLTIDKKNNENKDVQNSIKYFNSQNSLNYNNKYNKISTRKIFLSKEKERIENKIKLKKIQNNNNYELGDNDLTPETSLTNSQPRNSFLNSTIGKKYTKKLDTNNFMKQKIKLQNESNNMSFFSFSLPQIKSNEKVKENIPDLKKMKESNSGYLTHRFKNTLEEKINPIINLNEKSQKKLSYIKYHQIKSKNDSKIKKIMRRKTLMGILKDKEYYKSLKSIKTPKYSSIELPNRYKNMTYRNKYNVEFDN